MDNDVLLHDSLVVTAPGDKGHIVAAPSAKLLQRIGKGDAVGKTLFIKAGDLLYLVMHAAKIHGLYVYREFFPGHHVLGKLDRADFNYFSAEADGQFIEDGGLGTHCLIPFQIHHNVIHIENPFH